MINKKNGSALMQVLVLGGVIAGVVILLLRFSLVRASNVVKTSRKISAKAFAEGCMADLTARAMINELYGRPPFFVDPTLLSTFDCTYPVDPAGDITRSSPVEVLWLPFQQVITSVLNTQRPLYKLTFEIPTADDDRWQ